MGFQNSTFFSKLVHTFQDVVDGDSINHDYSYDIKDHCEIIFVSKKLIYTHQAHKSYKKSQFFRKEISLPPPPTISNTKFFLMISAVQILSLDDKKIIF